VKLTSIKLSGFKSFADPTHFELPGQMVGVVGPNGCGKSNIMDAVRWVLGETRASELRGESMQDVIFNGSATRKPAVRSSVELIFDNADHRAGGQWAQYSELAVKRVLTRDGSSSYYINNQAARRRDIQDIFLGTGLGPRAYAIIGQGMISRIIEAKPEELRVFLEEAAGVSKYKERRRETENRLADTRENLVRVQDILRELGTNLEKLESQAEVAQRFKALQAEGTTKLHQLWVMRKDEAAAEAAKVTEQIGKAQVELEARMAELRHAESELETVRQAQFASSDALNLAQGAFYESQAMVAKLEAEIKFVVDQKRKLEEQAEQIKAQSAAWGARQSDASREIDELAERTAQAEEEAAVAQAQAEEQQATVPVLEEELRQLQAQLADKRVEIAHIQQSIKAASGQSQLIEQQVSQLQNRRERLFTEKRGLNQPDALKLTDLKRQLALAEEQEHTLAARVEQVSSELPVRDEDRQKAQQQAVTEGTKLTDLNARLAALKALQDKVMTEGKLKPWLAKHGLESMPRLWGQLHTEPGWETALEAALRERLASIKMNSLDGAKAFASDVPAGKLTFYALPNAAQPHANAAGLKPLLDMVRIGDAGIKALLADWLTDVYAAQSLQEAVAMRDKLPAGGAFVVKEGHLVQRHSLSYYAPDSEQAGLLARQQEIENLEKQLRAQQMLADDARAAAVKAEAAYQEAQQQYQTERAQLTQLTTQNRTLQTQTLQLQQVVDQFTARSGQLEHDLSDIAAQLEQLVGTQAEGQAKFEELDAQLADQQQAYADFETTVIDKDRAVGDARSQLQALMLKSREAHFAVTTLRNRREELGRSLQTAQQEIERLAQSLQSNQGELFTLSDATAQAGLQAALAALSDKEQVLSLRRTETDDLTQKYRALDEQRMKLEHSLEPHRAKMMDLQLKEQAARLNGEQYSSQLAEASANEEELRSALPNGVRPNQLHNEVERINRDIAALGAVNLAALEELGQARERKQFLDAQQADLNEAIITLEDAIKKIDRETRELLQQTFDQVNLHFGKMFPALFGGGEARLVMTGDEILDSGVQVMAQPPGKRNSTIHLLSGGEKALTAVALVFAIFQLNPAPFCLLDEVDAPLDDANTERFAKLVQTMARETQFLFISHNKITMEMAEQLIGVTMQEQGVSRVVAVDIEDAVSFAEAA
jgi:chromosome segregation protein